MALFVVRRLLWFDGCVVDPARRAHHGGNEAESRTGKGEAGVGGEEAGGGGEAAGRGRDQEEAVVCQLQEGGHLLLLLEHQLLRLPVSAGALARAHEVVHAVR